MTFFSYKCSCQSWWIHYHVDVSCDLDDNYPTANIKNEYSSLSITFTTRKLAIPFHSLEKRFCSFTEHSLLRHSSNKSVQCSSIYVRVDYVLYLTTKFDSTRFFSNIETIEAGIGFEFVVLLPTLLNVMFTFIVSFVINWLLSLILLCLVIIVFGVSFVLGKVIVVIELVNLSDYYRSLLMKPRTS